MQTLIKISPQRKQQLNVGSRRSLFIIWPRIVVCLCRTALLTNVLALSYLQYRRS